MCCSIYRKVKCKNCRWKGVLMFTDVKCYSGICPKCQSYNLDLGEVIDKNEESFGLIKTTLSILAFVGIYKVLRFVFWEIKP